jgi:predicted deacetylase
MRYVILRDDDTNALTPVKCLERLYRPFLERGLPVNLAAIPNVSTTVTFPDGRPEGYLLAMRDPTQPSLPIGSNRELVTYLLENAGFHIVQHGFQHDYFEFDRDDLAEVESRLEWGTRLLLLAGFPRPRAFVAPYDKFSRTSLAAVAKHFSVISAGWYEMGRLPIAWWPEYLLKKLTGASHWRVGQRILLSHPGCLLSTHRSRENMFSEVRRAVQSQQLTVLVTHWWEYFPNLEPDDVFIEKLHRTAAYLADDPDIKVIAFSDLAGMNIPLN